MKRFFDNIMKNDAYKRIMSNMLNTDFKELIKVENNEIYFEDKKFEGKLIFTGKIDELFSYEFGELPYRSLKFESETLDEEYFQEVGTVNYPNNYEFTRITEFKHLTGQKNEKTSIIREYPKAYDVGKDIPYYPIPKKECNELYETYLEKSLKINNLILVGRLAEYRYYNMPQRVQTVVVSAQTVNVDRSIPIVLGIEGNLAHLGICKALHLFRRKLLVEHALSEDLAIISVVERVIDDVVDHHRRLLRDDGLADLSDELLGVLPEHIELERADPREDGGSTATRDDGGLRHLAHKVVSDPLTGAGIDVLLVRLGDVEVFAGIKGGARRPALLHASI